VESNRPQERESVPEHLWSMRNGDEFGKTKVVSNPFYIVRSRGKHGFRKVQAVEVECECGSRREIMCSGLMAGRSRLCRQCSLVKASDSTRRGSRAVNGIKKCSSCLKEKTIANFNADNASVDGFFSWCVDCIWGNAILSTYGVSVDQYEKMASKQGNRCGACGDEYHEAQLRGRGRWCIDHCHATGKVRGLLCDPCNKIIGMALENPERLRGQADYIERHRSSEG
jgi:hypothetical protein